MWTRCLLILGLLLAGCAPRPAADTGPRETLQVLFIGSSYLAWHDAPAVCRDLVQAHGQPIHVGKVLKPGLHLDELVRDPDVRRALAARPWDAVILQGGGMAVAYPESHHLILPRLGRHPVEATLRDWPHGAWRLVYVHPWAFEDGLTWIDGRTEDYGRMQDDIDRNVAAMAARLDLEIAPVGPAWRLARSERPTIPLFADDMNHPSLMGSYLMACVITRQLVGAVPETDRGRGAVPPATARYLRDVARRSVAER